MGIQIHTLEPAAYGRQGCFLFGRLPEYVLLFPELDARTALLILQEDFNIVSCA